MEAEESTKTFGNLHVKRGEKREREREVRQSGREERGKKDERKEVPEKAGWREKKEGMKGQEK